MRRSLSTNLMLSTSLALIAAMVLVFGLWAAFVHHAPAWLQERDLAEAAGRLVDGLQFDAHDRPFAVDVRNLQPVLAALPLDYLYQVVDERGNVLLSSSANPESLLPPNWVPVSTSTIFERTRAGVKLRVIAVPILRSKPASYFLVGRSQRFDETLLENQGSTARIAALLATLMALTVFATVVLVTVNRLLRRLRNTSEAAARIEPANFTARLSVEGVPREIAPLIESFNSALERLERGYRIQQDFLATAAHELKTPLALMRGEIEFGGPFDRGAVLRDLNHMTRQVHQLLHLAEVSDEGNFSVAPLDAARVVEDAVDFLSRMTQARGLVVDLHRPPGEVTIEADRGALFVLVRNLFENAAHHAPAHSTINVSVDRDSISVRDQGPGISTADMPMLFNRFWRGVHRRDDGAGLGLSICHEIAHAHGWTISVENASPGAVFTVHFKPSQGLELSAPGTSARGPRPRRDRADGAPVR